VVIPVALTISGSDPSGGAGMQADLKVFTAFRVYGAGVVTALTAQNTNGVRAIANLEPAFVVAQLDAVLDDLEVSAAKTGMLSRVGVVEAVASRLCARPIPNLIVDPVMVATAGDRLLAEDAVEALRRRLIPLARLVTPNLPEAEVLTGRRIDCATAMRDAARALVDLGAHAALVKGGHLQSGDAQSGDSIDVLYDGDSFHEFSAPRIATTNTHGTGCTLSAAIVAGLALGADLRTAVADAKDYLTRAIATAPGLGHGHGPLNHFAPTDRVEKGAKSK
jgi:hydroxymethylpyrimidine/phosphomethylpyrimidine kinase